MDKHNKDPIEEEMYGEPSPEDFIFTEEEIAKIEERTRKRQSLFRIIGIMIAFLLVIQGGYQLLHIYSRDARELARTSEELSKEEQIAELKEAVVTIQGERNKGTGFAIHPDGYILTNHHVVHRKGPLAVIFPNGSVYHGEIVESNEELDVALLKIDENDLPFLTISSQQASENEKIYVIGNPLSQTQIVNEGEVVNEEKPFQVMKISNPTFPGHSGSPVLSESGNVVGIVYARTVPRFRSGEESYGLAVPMEYIIEAIPTISSLLKE